MSSRRHDALPWSRCAAVFTALLALFAGGCGQTPEAAAPAPAPAAAPTAPPAAALEIRSPRVSLQPGMGAVYLEVVDAGGQGDRLVSVETAAATAAETHETVTDEGGVLRMVARPEGFDVPPGGTLELAPGGKHIMLVEPQVPASGLLPLTLHFAGAGAIEVEARVEAAAEDHGAHEMDHAHHGT